MQTRWPPEDQPVCGKHLAEFRDRHDYSVAYLTGIFGLASAQAFYRIVNEPERPVPDIAIAILIRFYSAHPERLPYRSVTPHDLAASLKITTEALAVSLGRVPLVGQQWESGAEKKPMAPARNLMYEIAVSDERLESLERVVENLEKKGGRVVSARNLAKEIRKILQKQGTARSIYEEIDRFHRIERAARGEDVPSLPRHEARSGRRLVGGMIEAI